LNRKGLAVGLILLFIVSIVAPMVIGYKTNPTEKYNKYDFDSYHISEIYNHEKQIRSNPVPDTVTSDISVSYKETASPSNVMSPMDSPWPMYCHDVRHTGRSPYSTSNNFGNEKWYFPMVQGASGSPVIDKDGTVYIGGHEFYAINSDGTLKWKYDVPHDIEMAPAIDDNGVIYVGTEYAMPNYLYAFYPNGTLKWTYCTGNHITSSPAIGEDGTIYFGDWNGYINALNPNGTLRWRYKTGDAVLSSPAIGNDQIIYCGSHDNGLYALYPNNGTMKWRFGTGGWVRTAPCIADDGTIYCVSLDNYLYVVYPNGSMKWRTNVGAGTSPTIGQDGTIYAGYSDLYAINPINGSVKWIFNPGLGRTIRGATPCNSVDGTIYFGTFDGGELIAVNSNGTEKWRKNIGTCDSAPAIAEDGTIYMGTSYEGGGGLLAFGPGEPKKIEIQQPEPGKLYLFGLGVVRTISGNTVIIGSVNVKVHAYSEDQLEGIYFYVDGKYQYNVTTPPFEWNMNQHYGKLFPLRHTITVTATYKGGCTWSESIDVMYFHLSQN
jgi:outer membrane protein assembly factor BamB